MSEVDALSVFRSAVTGKVKYEFRLADGSATNDIGPATVVHFEPVPGFGEDAIDLELDRPTQFEVEDKASGDKRKLPLKAVIQCQLYKNANMAEYLTQSAEKGIPTLRFLERSELLAWLEGASTASEYIAPLEAGAARETKRAAESSVVPAKREIDPELREIYENERVLVDHNTALRGSKAIDFSSVSSECVSKILTPFKSRKTKGAAAAAHHRAAGAAASSSSGGSGKDRRRNEPVILISPSMSSVLNRANAKEFFEQGVFAPAVNSAGAGSAIQFMSRYSPKLGSKVRFVVADSVENFKPENWSRVVAVFVTGQPWQLKSYFWPDPNELFRKVMGFAVVYKGDPVPPALKHWNVNIIELDRNKRFKDKEAVEKIWDRIDTVLAKRGYS
ncbi:cell division control protein 73 [Trichomonascus vanleenenianus]|uniref:Cdc73p n=1 Tax=Trichomonascus vanleenenianus TaxID=2268995 RepID=UPI003EC9A4A8